MAYIISVVAKANVDNVMTEYIKPTKTEHTKY